MQHQVTAKQPNSKMCLVCGLKNSSGFKSFFYELDNGDLLAIFKPMTEHQGYPGRLHGGIVTAILDETIGRTIMSQYGNDIWGVTMSFNIRFKKPVPLDDEIRVVGRITKERNLYFEGSGEILLADGTVAVEGQGKYMKLPLEKIANLDFDAQEWAVVASEKDPEVVDLPDK